MEREYKAAEIFKQKPGSVLIKTPVIFNGLTVTINDGALRFR